MSITNATFPYGIDCATYNENEAFQTALTTSLKEAKEKGIISQDALIEQPLLSPENEPAKTEKSSTSSAAPVEPARVGTLVINSKSEKSDAQATEPEPITKQVVKLEPTTNEEWTKFPIAWYEKTTLAGVQLLGTPLRSVIEWGIQKKIPQTTWEKVTKLNLWTYHTAGDFERVGIQLILENPGYTPAEQIESHAKVKALLKGYAEAGGWFGLLGQKAAGLPAWSWSLVSS